MTQTLDDLARALDPLVSRLRQDVSAVRSAAGKVFRSDEPITEERLKRHLNGGSSRGLYLLLEGRSTVFSAVFDLDDHAKTMAWDDVVLIAMAIMQACHERGLIAIPFRSSGGGGIHLWFIWETAQDAYSVRMALREVLAAVGLSDGTAGLERKQVEIFPKQNEVKKGRFGSQAWLPLARASVPLDVSGLLGDLAPLPKDAILSVEWRTSAPVKRLTKPVLDVASLTPCADMGRYRSMLSFIRFDAGDCYSYKVWLETIGFGLHHASGGSDEGFDIWNEWLAKSAKYTSTEECRYKWDTILGDDNGEGLITGRSIEALAREWGWQDDLSGDFEDYTGADASDQGKIAADAEAREARGVGVAPDVLRDGEAATFIIADAVNWYAIGREVHKRLYKEAGGMDTCLFSQGHWYVYAGGVWRFAERIEIEKQVGDLLDAAWVVGEGAIKKPFKPAARHLSEVVKVLERLLYVKEVISPSWIGTAAGVDRSDAVDWLCLKDGLVNVTTREFAEHSPAFFTLNQLPYAWNAENVGVVEWLAFLKSVWPDDQESIDFLQEWFGYLSVADTSLQKMLLIYGPPRTGKGTIGRVLVGLLGANNVAPTSTSALAADFGLQDLIGKLVALLPDVRNLSARGSNNQRSVERMLSISGEDHIRIDCKFEKAWAGRLTSRLVFMANEIPAPGDSAGALTKRFMILKTSVSFYGREDTRLDGRLSGEMSGILRWSMDGLARLRRRGHFVQPNSSAKELENMSDANNPVRGFIKWFIEQYQYEAELIESGEYEVGRDMVVMTGGAALLDAGGVGWNLAGVPFDLLYSKYEGWCKDSGVHALQRHGIFPKALVGAFDGYVSVEDRRIAGGAHDADGVLTQGCVRRLRVVDGLDLVASYIGQRKFFQGDTQKVHGEGLL